MKEGRIYLHAICTSMIEPKEKDSLSIVLGALEFFQIVINDTFFEP